MVEKKNLKRFKSAMFTVFIVAFYITAWSGRSYI
jgi:hypothetical protein